MTRSADHHATVAPAFSGKSAGFTLLEILVALAIVTALTAISYPIYSDYINKAKITRAIYTLETTRKALELYHINNLGYPPDIDFSSGLDSQGKTVLPTALLAEYKSSIFTVDSYIVATLDYTLNARAMDAKRTRLIMTPGQVVTQGP